MRTKANIALSLSQSIVEWLEKKKKKSINISSFVNKILQDAKIKEMEGNSENA